jgi:ATP-dependent RNA helicase DeaD
MTSEESTAPAISNPALAAALYARGYKSLTPVQAAVVASDAGERDLLVSAQTGSGKTVAYGLALASTLLGGETRFAQADLPLALIVAPTRELALQVRQELGWLYADTGARIATAVGGMDIRREQRALADGAHIVVGTPGRLRDHLERGRLDVSALRAVVLDEADEMLDLGFREDLELILDSVPPTRRTLLFSATLPREIVRMARRYQKDALRIDTIVENQPHGDIEYRALRVAPNEVELGVVNTLRFFDVGATLVFCATRESVRHLHASLVERGFAAVALSGELSQSERNHALQALRDGRARVCVATDVAARGLDLPDLGLVVHADLPTGPAVMLHRSGRTGRAGRKGVSALLVPYTQRAKALRLIRAAGVDARWSAAPSADEIRALDRERLLASFTDAEPATPEDEQIAAALLERIGPQAAATALVRLARARLPEPEELVDVGQAPEERRGNRERPQRGQRGDFSRTDRPSDDHHERPRRGQRDVEGGDAVWFRLSVGRQKNADPKWLLPLICRRGHVTKNEIGAIKIFERDSKFEIAAEAAERFEEALRRTDDEEIRIERAEAPGAGAPSAPAGKPKGSYGKARKDRGGKDPAGKERAGKDTAGRDRFAKGRPRKERPDRPDRH